MLSCQDCERYLSLFLDGAFEAKESLDVQEHLRRCKSCADGMEAEWAWRAFVRQHAAVPPLSEAHKRRIIRRARGAAGAWRWPPSPRLSGRVRDLSIGALAAAALVLLVLNPFARPPAGEEAMQTLLRETSMTYTIYTTQAVPLEVINADAQTVPTWFANHIGVRVAMPYVNNQAVQLRGGRLCRLLDRKAALLMYQHRDANVLLLVVKNEALSLPAARLTRVGDHAFYVGAAAGRPVAVWQHRGLTYAMVGDLERDYLLHLAASIDYR